MNTRLGCIGFGQMGGAILEGLVSSRVFTAKEILVGVHSEETKKRAEGLGYIALQNEEVAREAEVLLLAVKPYQVKDVLEEISPQLENTLVISVAAGISGKDLEELLPEGVHGISAMPNIPMKVGRGILICDPNSQATEEEWAILLEIFSPIASVLSLEEKSRGAAGVLTGCGPAFVGVFIEALADAAVKYGVPRRDALLLAAKMVEGSAALIAEGTHPALLKDAVCSPGGTTIRGVEALEHGGLRASVYDAFFAILEKSSH